MAEATATRPTRQRAARASKATPAKAPAAQEAPQTSPDGNVERFVVSLDHAGDTKSYSVWAPPAGSGCVGKLYAPLGATEVKVAIKGGTE